MKWRLMQIPVVATALLSMSASAIAVTSSDTAVYDGAAPSGRIAMLAGVVYGTTEYGGPNCRQRISYQETSGCGVVYRVSGDGHYSVLHAFTGDDGRKPTSGLVLGRDGRLYGATDTGGAHSHGVIYRLAPDGSGFTVLYAFTSGDRHGALTVGDDGAVYGVAPAPDGTGHGATIFALPADGAYRTLHSFGLESHVASPLAVDSTGALVGIVVRTKDCGGEIFRVTMSGAFSRVFSNAQPYVSPKCAAARVPSSPLFESAGTLYATDSSSLFSVGRNGFTVLFSLPKIAHQRYDLPSRSEGIIVDGSLASAPDGALIGAVTGSRAKGCGDIFRFSSAAGFSTLHTFAPTDGACFSPPANPAATAMGFAFGSDGALYGTAPLGADCAAHDPRPTAPRSCGAFYHIAAGIATIAHVFEPLDPPVPDRNRFPVGAWFGVLGARPPGDLMIQVSVAPLAQAPYSVRTGTSALALHSADDPATTIPLRFDQDDWTIAESAGDSRSATGVVSASATDLPPGMYAVDVSRFNPVVADADGYGIPLDRLFPTSLYVPPLPAAQPELRSGQQFVTFHQPTSNGHPVPEPLGIQILTLQAAARTSDAGFRLTFKTEGSDVTTSVDVKSADVNAVPGLTPIVSDATVERLNDKYRGRDVYVLGDFSPACSFADGGGTNVAIDRTEPLHVKRIVRLYGVSASWGIGPMASRILETGSMYVAVDPILVIFDAKDDGSVLTEPPFAGRGCVRGFAEFADAWDFGRTLAPVSPLLSHPEWPADVRKAINDGTVLLGMSYDMVVASVGYPSVYGTASQMRKLDTWEFVLPPPSSFTVKFKNGKVVEYAPPRMLP